MFDTTVTYDENAMDDLAVGFAKQQDRETRSPRYKPQVRDSLATLPLYLEQLKRPTFVFPGIPSEWSGPILVRNFEEIREFIYELSKQGPGDGQHSLGQSA